MKKTVLFLSILLLNVTKVSLGQVENVPLNSPVYTFLKEMKVKGILPYISEDVPNLSRFQVRDFLDSVKNHWDELSDIEKEFTQRYLDEFSDIMDDETTSILFNPGTKFTQTASEFFSNKIKYTFVHQEENANFYFEMLQDFYYGSTFKPSAEDVFIYDFGFRVRGTTFKHLGYYFAFQKGGVWGNRKTAELLLPALRYNTKWVMENEDIKNYDFVSSYLKYYVQPAEDMHISLQLGREPITAGYGYGSKLVLSGMHPIMDFFKFNFNYGIFHLSSIHASTVGEYFRNRDDRFTKFWAFNRLKITIPNLFDIGVGESIVYSKRGIDLAYFPPVGFYKFIEIALQDRDNGNLYFDLQTKFLKNLELQGTFFLDENFVGYLSNPDNFANKVAYQLGAMWYEAFTLNNFSLVFEYTKIRPFVYTHFNRDNSYTSFGTNLGHYIGPNADEIFTRLAYNFNSCLRLELDYRHVRRGENVYNEEGNLVKNVGSDVFLTHGSRPDNKSAPFLDGIRINHDIYQAKLRIEPIRDYIFEIIYNYHIENNLTIGEKSDQSFAYIRLIWEY